MPISQAIPRGKLLKNTTSPQTLSLHIRKKYRPKIEFSLVSKEHSHWAVNRLYIRYVNEYAWTIKPPPIEAMMFQNNYKVVLSRHFTEYDLLPLTPDNEIHHFAYRGLDSDHFSVHISGTEVSRIKICADLYDFNTKESLAFESESIEIVTSGIMEPLWDQPLG